jgi:hypothetical protein
MGKIIVIRRLPRFLVIGLLACLGACSKSQPISEEPAQGASVDHIVVSKPQASNNLLHKTFAVKTYEAFGFTVPAHMVKPVLHGSFESFAKNKTGDLLSSASADVDLLILNDQEFDDFSRGKQGSATYAVDPSHSQTVTYAVPATVGEAQNYHLVFRNSPGGARSKLVKADFTVRFE